MSEAGQLLVGALALCLGIGLWHQRSGAQSPVAMGATPLVELGAARATPDALWVDARGAAAYARGHVPGAVSDPAGDGDAGFARILDHWSSGQPIIVYCYSDACDAATEVARALRADLPEASIQVLAGGWSAWQESQP